MRNTHFPEYIAMKEYKSEAQTRYMLGQVPTLFPAGVLGHQERKREWNNFGHGTLSAIGLQPQRKIKNLKKEQSRTHTQAQLQPARASQLLPTTHMLVRKLKQRRKITYQFTNQGSYFLFHLGVNQFCKPS